MSEGHGHLCTASCGTEVSRAGGGWTGMRTGSGHRQIWGHPDDFVDSTHKGWEVGSERESQAGF